MALEAFWLPLLPAYLIGLLASWALEVLLLPRPQAPWRRGAAANLTHVGVWTLAFALEMALFQRPYFAIANVLAIELLLVLVSRAKYEALQEPFVYPDFEYFTDAIKHPRLYLPFFGWGKALVCAGGYGVALWGGLVLESAVTALPGGPDGALLYSCLALLALAGLACSVIAGRRLHATFDADQDLRRLGFVAALWVYANAERAPLDALLQQAPFASLHVPTVPGDQLPDLISIQSESFFDVRSAYGIVREDVLEGFDTLCNEAVAYGALHVAARGANTVRTEFAFLSGIDPEKLGVHRYNPYRRLAGRGVPTLASHLRKLGYRTVCIHPYFASFYRRDKVLPKLGFDEFIDLRAFGQAEKVGAYVGDKALAEYVIRMLSVRSDPRPLYVHVITMENHGPLHLEAVSAEAVNDVLTGPMPAGCADLVAYARHIRNADAMFDMLRKHLSGNARPASLCIFGDHVPVMPKVYRTLGDVPGNSHYVIWRNDAQKSGDSMDMSIARLAQEFVASLFSGVSVSGCVVKQECNHPRL